jgi:arginase
VERAAREVAVIGGTLDLGAGRRGVDMGPSAIRYAGLDQQLTDKLGVRVLDEGNVISPVVETAEVGDERARYLPQTSPSGNVHGMVLAAALGLAGGAFRREGWQIPAVEPGKLALVGVRSLDDGERELLGTIDAKVFTMSEVDRIGVEPCMREALAHASGAGFLHVSLDMDVVDPDYAPGVGTPVRGGLSYREAHLALETVAEYGRTDSMDVVEVNPILDRENATGQLAVELVVSALGARIL